MKKQKVKVDGKIIDGMRDAICKLSSGLGDAYSFHFASKFVEKLKLVTLEFKWSKKAISYGVKAYVNQDDVSKHYYLLIKFLCSSISKYYTTKISKM